MRTIPSELLDRVKKRWQVPAENAEPKMKIYLSRGFLNELFQVFTIQEGAELTDVDVTVRRPDTTALPTEAFAIAISDGVAQVKSKPLPYDDQYSWRHQFTVSGAISGEEFVIEDITFTNGIFTDVVADGGDLILATLGGGNLWNGQSDVRYLSAGQFFDNASTRTTKAIPVKGNTQYTIVGGNRLRVRWEKALGVLVGWEDLTAPADTSTPITVTTPADATQGYFYYSNIGDLDIIIQEGTSITSSGYANTGNRISTATSLEIISNVSSTEITWGETKPENTNIIIEVGYSDSVVTRPSTWYECTNNAALPYFPTGTTGQYIWVKQTLSTTDGLSTPVLSSVSIAINYGEQSQSIVTGISSVAIEFDGFWDRDYNTRRFNFVTDEYPWLFYVQGGNLYAQHWQDDPLLLATSVTKCAAIRGWVPVAGDTTNDQGLVIAYLKTDGKMYYRSYCIQTGGLKDWEIQREVTPLGDTIDDLALFRTSDFRLGFIAEKSGNVHWTMTERNYAGMSYWPELLTGKFNGFTAIDLIEIDYVDVIAPVEHLTGRYDTLCIGLNLEADVVGACTGADITGESEITLKFSQPLAGNIARIKDLIMVSNEAMTVYYTPVSTAIGDANNKLVLTVAELLDTESASTVTVGEATIYLQPSGTGSMLPMAPFSVDASLDKDPYHLVNMTGQFNMTTINFIEIVASSTANQEVASLTGKFNGFTSIVLTKVGSVDV